jgi:hypothetical protein
MQGLFALNSRGFSGAKTSQKGSKRALKRLEEHVTDWGVSPGSDHHGNPMVERALVESPG